MSQITLPKKILDCIRTFYPAGAYDQRCALTRQIDAAKMVVRTLHSEIRRGPNVGFIIEHDPGYDVCYRITLCTPDESIYVGWLKSSASSQHPMRGTKLDSQIMLQLFISQLGPFFMIRWRQFRVRRRQVILSDRIAQPTTFWATTLIGVRKCLTGLGFQEISKMVASSVVRGVSSGDSTIEEGCVTVHHCVFSEINM